MRKGELLLCDLHGDVVYSWTIGDRPEGKKPEELECDLYLSDLESCPEAERGGLGRQIRSYLERNL